MRDAKSFPPLAMGKRGMRGGAEDGGGGEEELEAPPSHPSLSGMPS